MRPFIRTLYVQGSDPDLAGKLGTFGPTTLTSTPATLDALALAPGRPRLPALRQVVTWSEVLSGPARARIATAFGAPVLPGSWSTPRTSTLRSES